jgi:hypothetical protein
MCFGVFSVVNSAEFVPCSYYDRPFIYSTRILRKDKWDAFSSSSISSISNSSSSSSSGSSSSSSILVVAVELVVVIVMKVKEM